MAESSKKSNEEATKEHVNQSEKANVVPVNTTPKKVVKPMPTLGGSYQRDPATGALTLIERSQPTPPRASTKKEGK